MKTIKVNHVVLTLKIAPSGAGMTRDEVDELVNKRLSEGYDDVQIYPVKTNFSERNEPTDLVQLYIFKKHGEEDAVSGEVRGPGRPKKSE